MVTDSLILVILITALLGLCLISLFRNEEVCDFQLKVNHAAFGNLINWLDKIEDDNELHEKWDEYQRRQNLLDGIVNDYKRSYTKMLFVMKPLNLENWYTEEEIEFIKEGDTNHALS